MVYTVASVMNTTIGPTMRAMVRELLRLCSLTDMLYIWHVLHLISPYSFSDQIIPDISNKTVRKQNLHINNPFITYNCETHRLGVIFQMTVYLTRFELQTHNLPSTDSSITCVSSSGNMSLSRCQLFEAGLHSSALHLQDETCKGTLQDGQLVFHFDNDEHLCGTVLRVLSDSDIFYQSIYALLHFWNVLL